MHYFIGWDVGGWNCDKNVNSRDAIVVMNANREVVGNAWRGNLRTLINQAQSAHELIAGLFKLCQVPNNLTPHDHVLLAIDIPLGFSTAFIDLLVKKKVADKIADSANNPYLYRYTERFLFKHGLKPLSSIKDMIGSQSTKGMHLLAKFMPIEESCGVWSDGESIKAIEAYPSACKHSICVNELLTPFLEQPAEFNQQTKKATRTPLTEWQNADEFDALICALLGWCQIKQPELIVQPDKLASPQEGWIFVPVDSLS